jgi:integrase
MAAKLTRARIKDALAEAPETGERFVFDSEVPGFALRIRGGATPEERAKRARWVFVYRVGGRPRKVVIDHFTAQTVEEARDAASDYRRDARKGADLAEDRREARRKKLTVAELLALYVADFEKRVETGKRRGRRSTLQEFERVARVSIVPSLGRVEVEALDHGRVKRWHSSLAATPAGANRALTTLGAALGFGEREGLVAPGTRDRCVARVERFTEQPKAERLELSEVERLGAALREAEGSGKVNPSAALALRLLLLAGLRRSEVLGHALAGRRSEGDGVRWGDVDLDAGTIQLRQAKAGARIVILGAPLIAALRRARPEGAAADAWVCPGERPGAAFIAFDKAVRPIFEAAGVPWRGSHAFRRTFASVAGEQGFGEYIVGALLGHSKGGVTSRYVLVQGDPLRAAADRVSGEIAAALDGKRAPVLPFKREGQEA